MGPVTCIVADLQGTGASTFSFCIHTHRMAGLEQRRTRTSRVVRWVPGVGGSSSRPVSRHRPCTPEARQLNQGSASSFVASLHETHPFFPERFALLRVRARLSNTQRLAGIGGPQRVIHIPVGCEERLWENIETAPSPQPRAPATVADPQYRNITKQPSSNPLKPRHLCVGSSQAGIVDPRKTSLVKGALQHSATHLAAGQTRDDFEANITPSQNRLRTGRHVHGSDVKERLRKTLGIARTSTCTVAAPCAEMTSNNVLMFTAS